MRLLAGILLFLAQPFWEAKPPEKWSEQEIQTLLHDSPWAVTVGPTVDILIYLATAAPIEEAEAEARVRSRNPLPEPDPDYLDYLREHREKQLVLAIPYPDPKPWLPAEEHKMEEQSVMVVGRRTHKMVGHFPPTQADPVLRLVFPRDGEASDKSILFRLYLPGVQFPERQADFRIKDLMYHGKLEM